MTKINVLGTEYLILRQDKHENPKMEESAGICEQYSKRIVLDTFEDVKNEKMCIDGFPEYEKKVLRHEIIHAFLGESGLREESDWAENEEAIDWFAIQFEKLLKAFQEAGAI